MAKTGSLIVVLGLDSRSFTRSLQQATRALQRTGGQLKSAGLALSTAVTAPLGLAGVAALKMSADFDRAFTKSTAIMGDLSQAMRGELREAAIEMARDSIFSATQTAEAIQFLAQAGLSAEQSLASLPQVLAFATAGNFDLATATDLLTDAQTALGLSSTETGEHLRNMARVSDVLVKANTIANASSQQFAEALTNGVAATAKVAGKDVEEVTAVLAAFAAQGEKGDQAATRMSIAFNELTSKAIENRHVFHALGVRVYDESTGALLNLAEIVDSLTEKLGGLSDEARTATLIQLGFGVKTLKAIQQLIGAGDMIRDFEAKLRAAGGTTDEVADKSVRNLGDQFTLALRPVQELGIIIGDELAPILEGFISLFRDYAFPALETLRDVLGEIPGYVKAIGVAVVGATVSIGALSLALGFLVSALAAIVSPIILAVAVVAIFAGVVFGLVAAWRSGLIQLDAVVAQWAKDLGRKMNAAMLVIRGLNDTLPESLRLSKEAINAGADAARTLASIDVDEARRRATEASAKAMGDFALNLANLRTKVIETAQAIRNGLGGALSGGSADGEGKGLKEKAEEAAQGLQKLFEQIKLAETELNQQSETATDKWAKRLAEKIVKWRDSVVELVEQAADGIGNALGRAIVFGEDFGQALAGVFAQMAAKIIAELASIIVQMVLFSAISAALRRKDALSTAATSASMVFSQVFQGAIETFPFPINYILAPILATAAAASLLAGAFAYFAEGGLVTGPVAGIVGEAGPELIIPLDRVGDVLGAGGTTTVYLEIDGRTLGRASFEHGVREARLVLGNAV